MANDPRKYFENRRRVLKQQRQPWDARAEEIARYEFPELGRFNKNSSQTDLGQSKREAIINNMLTQYGLILRAGMLSGMTSPVRPWLRLGTLDTALSKFLPVRRWLDFVGKRLLAQFSSSNVYRAIGNVYMECGYFGANVMFLQEDVDDVIRGYGSTWGEFVLGIDYRGEVNTVYREGSMTVWSLVDAFKLDNVSAYVKDCYNKGHYDKIIDIVHCVEPHQNDIDGVEFRLKQWKWRSVYYECGEKGAGKFLDVKGYDRKPFFAPRWATCSPSDVYGRYCPGIITLGDAIELQHHEVMKARAQEMQTDPAILVPSTHSYGVKIGPSAVTRYDVTQGDPAIRPMFEVKYNVDHSRMSINDIQERGKTAYHVDLFRAVMEVRARSVSTQITAREVDQLEKEGLVQLGPVTESFDDELLDPFIESAFSIQLANGDYPPPPKELEGQPLKVEYLGLIHQAQKLVGLLPFDRVHQFAGQIVEITQDATIFDVINKDEAVREYADMAGYPPDLIRDDQELAAFRQQRQQMMQAAQALELAGNAADTARTMSEIPADNSGNALGRVLEGAGVA